MNCHTSNKIAVGLPAVDLLMCVVVEDAELHIVCSSDDPAFSRNELGRTDYHSKRME